jgi:hypothetical protein
MSVKKCPVGMIISEFDYETLRKKNLGKVRNYYNTVLSDYTEKYYKYSNKKLSENQDDIDNSAYLIKEKGSISSLNDDLIDISKNLNQVVLDDFADIKKQINEVKSLEGDLEAGRVRVRDLNDAISKQNINSSAHQSNLEGTKDMRSTYEYKYKIHIISVIILTLIIIVIIYMILADDTNPTSNKINNNLRNILNMNMPNVNNTSNANTSNTNKINNNLRNMLNMNNTNNKNTNTSNTNNKNNVPNNDLLNNLLTNNKKN